MIRRLTAILAAVALLSMAPAGHATSFPMGGGPDAFGSSSPLMADNTDAQCQGGNPCLLVCAACFPAPAGQAGEHVLAEPKTNTGPEHLASFDLSWRLYRPPKAG